VVTVLETKDEKYNITLQYPVARRFLSKISGVLTNICTHTIYKRGTHSILASTRVEAG
jgi:hypothetical protein